MDLRDEIRLSKDDPLRQSSSLPFSDQNKPRKVNSGARKAMVTSRGSPRRWITSDMVLASKFGHQVLNAKLVSEFNPNIGHVEPVKDKAQDDVPNKNKDSDVVKDVLKNVVKDGVKDVVPDVVMKQVVANKKKMRQTELPKLE
ncbi:hypothetical protein Tco_1515009 [Tanacetum coccineum]